MGLPELLARLQRDALAREDATRQRAREEAALLVEHAGAAAARRRDDELARRRDARRARLASELASARRAARAARLAAEHALVDRVMTRAEAAIGESAAGPALLAAMPRLATLALRHLEGVPATLRCRPELAGPVRDAAAGHVNIAIDEDPAAPAGLLAEARDGSVLVDATIAGSLRRARARLAIEIVAELGR